MFVYPLSRAEEQIVRWVGWLVPVVSVVVVLLLTVAAFSR
jgi:hypothetical protein